MIHLFQKIENGFYIFFYSLGEQLSRCFLWCPVFMAMGVLAYFYPKNTPAITFGSAFVLTAIFIVFYFVFRRENSTVIDDDFLYQRHSKKRASYAFFFFACACFSLGFAVSDYRTKTKGTVFITSDIYPTWITAQIQDSDKHINGYRYILDDVQLDDDGAYDSTIEAFETMDKIRILIRQDHEPLAIGSIVRLRVSLKAPSPPAMPEGYDFQRALYFQGINAVGYAVSLSEMTVIEESSEQTNIRTRIYLLFENWRQEITKAVYEHIDNPETAAVVTTFMTGDKKAIPKDTHTAIRDSGLAHLLAISGLHLGFIAGILFFMVRALLALSQRWALHYDLKKASALVALIGAFGFMLIVGASIPTQRAMIMTGLALIAVMVERRAISLRLVALAAIIIIAFSPQEVLSLSFQLSFAAVIALVVCYERLHPFMGYLYRDAGTVRKVMIYFIGVILTSIIASIATAPFVLQAFNHLPLYGVLANLLALPIMAVLVMPFIILGYLSFFVGGQAIVFYVLDKSVGFILDIAQWTSVLEGGIIEMQTWPIEALFLMVLGALISLLWIGRFGKASGGVLIVIGCLLIPIHKQPIMMITDDLSLIAVRDADDTYFISNGRKNKFIRDQWLGANAQKGFDLFQSENETVSCDGDGCIAKIDDRIIALPKNYQAVKKDCQKADLVITDIRMNSKTRRQLGCYKDKLIQGWDLRHKEIIALYKNKDGFEMKTVADSRGNRPWVVKP